MSESILNWVVPVTAFAGWVWFMKWLCASSNDEYYASQHLSAMRSEELRAARLKNDKEELECKKLHQELDKKQP